MKGSQELTAAIFAAKLGGIFMPPPPPNGAPLTPAFNAGPALPAPAAPGTRLTAAGGAEARGYNGGGAALAVPPADVGGDNGDNEDEALDPVGDDIVAAVPAGAVGNDSGRLGREGDACDADPAPSKVADDVAKDADCSAKADVVLPSTPSALVVAVLVVVVELTASRVWSPLTSRGEVDDVAVSVELSSP